ncbi:3-oxoacyl-[acyl-carrier-protein] synthase III C-terminal domain-containing protein [Streptomyces sp. NPDC051569]|uniref:3-oxoacyl-[acyl-carrier-protein] synthase III C-terminal domain-containing protein n=1 Tax=Streptomyces sp. NPDC051569 TaxID=3365661 RepID=UPI00378DE32D
MTALLEVACHLPQESVPIERIGAESGVSARQIRLFRRFYGLSEVRRAPGRDLRSILTSAVESLTTLRGREHRVRYLVLARSVATVAPADENPAEDLCVALGLTGAVAFTVTQHACATGLLAVDLVGRMLADDGDPEALGLVLTGEKAVSDALQLVPGSTVMGESTAAVLVGADGGHDQLLSYATHTYGEYAEGFPPHPVDPGFFKEHNALLSGVMREAAASAGVALDDLALILPHNVNRLVWTNLGEQLGVAGERIFLDNMPVTGHCFTADPFINHVHARERGRLRPGDLYLMAAVGLGATFSAAVFRH